MPDAGGGMRGGGDREEAGGGITGICESCLAAEPDVAVLVETDIIDGVEPVQLVVAGVFPDEIVGIPGWGGADQITGIGKPDTPLFVLAAGINFVVIRKRDVGEGGIVDKGVAI